MKAGGCYANRNLVSSNDVTKNKKVINIESNIAVIAGNIVIGGGKQERKDDFLNIDPVIETSGIKTTFQQATGSYLLYSPGVEKIYFENLYCDKEEVSEITTCMLDFTNLTSVIILSSIDEKGKMTNPISKKLGKHIEEIGNNKINEKVISTCGIYYQSSGNPIQSKQFKLENYKVNNVNKPVNDKCCHHEKDSTNKSC